MSLLLVALLAALLPHSASASSTEAVKLTNSNFKTSTDDGNVWFIKFYAPW